MMCEVVLGHLGLARCRAAAGEGLGTLGTEGALRACRMWRAQNPRNRQALRLDGPVKGLEAAEGVGLIPWQPPGRSDRAWC